MTIYRYLDRPIDAVSARSRSLVVAMRIWVTGARSGRCPCGRTAQALGLAPRHDALGHFNMMMATLDHESGRTLTFGMQGAPRLSDDEAAILALYDAAAAYDADGVRRMAESLVETVAVTRFVTAVSLLSTALAAAPHVPHDTQDPL